MKKYRKCGNCKGKGFAPPTDNVLQNIPARLLPEGAYLCEACGGSGRAGQFDPENIGQKLDVITKEKKWKNNG